MSGGQAPRWNTVKNVQLALRKGDRDDGETKGLEQRRDYSRPPTNDPPQPTCRPYGIPQQYISDPGPHAGHVPWDSSQNPPSQGPPPLLYNHNYPSHYQAGSNPQGYGVASPPISYPPTYSQAYGQNQSYFNPPAPASHPSHNPAYQQQPWGSPSYQGGQGAYQPYPHDQTSYQSASSFYSPPLPHRPGSQDTQGLSQNANLAGQSYPAQSTGGSLIRPVTAPARLHCEHRDPGNGFCPACEPKYQYGGGR